MAAISYDSQEALADFSGRRGITFPLLSDADSGTITAFGILNTVAEEGLGPNRDDPAVVADVERYVSVRGASRLIVGTPYPGTFVIDRQGRVTSRFFEEFYRERSSASSIMVRLGTAIAPIAGMQGSTAHLAINAYPSNPEITFGSRFSLALDIEPQPGMHVYAPGASDLGYRVIALTIAPQRFVRLPPVRYPASEIYHFEPLDERVPVYQKPFTLVQDVIFEGSQPAQEALGDLDALTLTGRLDYQACDDTVCFDPMSVPLSWTLTITPLDRQRANRPQ